jgi:hypothetical protein
MTWLERSRSGTETMSSGGGPFSLEEVGRLDVEAVRRCDGFEFRYHQGGTVTWLEKASSREIRVPVLVGVPSDGWRHLDGCACPSCLGTAPRQASAGTGAKAPDVVQ